MGEWFEAPLGDLAAVAASVVVMYAAGVVLLRAAGRRTLTHMSAFDFVVTIALGTIVGGTAVTADPPVAKGLTAIATLLGLQVVVGSIRQKSATVRRLLDFRPIPVYREGELDLKSSVFSAQLTREDIESALRLRGIDGFEGVALVVLEKDGSLSFFESLDGEFLRDFT